MKTNVIGLSGISGAGKTTTAKIMMAHLKNAYGLECNIISGDKVGGKVFNDLFGNKSLELFGAEKVVYNKEDGIDKDGVIMGRILFSDKNMDLYKKLCQETWPEVQKRLFTIIEANKKLNIPTIVDYNYAPVYHSIFDTTIQIVTDPEINASRLLLRGSGCPRYRAEQKWEATKEIYTDHKPDYIINNDGDIKNLERQVKNISSKLFAKNK